jgi:tol-pal system protein YbgF
MNKRWLELALGLGLTVLPAASILADAPIVQGHEPQSVTDNSLVTPAPQAAAPAEPAAVTQTPDQALVTADDSATSNTPPAATGNSPLAMASQIAALQQQVMDLRGQLEVQQHTITQLQSQQQQQYQDILARVSQASGGKISATPNPAVATAPATVTSTPATPAATQAVPATAPVAATDNPQEEQLYQQAYSQLVAKQYSQASVSLQTYLQQYPTGQNAANAHYWLGELALIQGNPTAALSQFNLVVAQFAQAPKAADSMLKIGMIYYDQAQWQKAKSQFTSVVNKYPGTPSAQLAQQQLQQMQKQGQG